MTDPTSTVAPGWYPDTTAPGLQRWWDGTQWTEHHAPLHQAPAELKAPAGTKTGTVWIWLIALLPLLGLPALFLIDIQGYMQGILQNPTGSSSALALFTSPGYLLAIVLGWGSTIATIVFAFIDWRTLKQRNVPQPFHWAFAFLVLVSAGIVYPIGRSVVAKRRAGGSLAPMYVAIAVFGTLIVVSIVWSIIITTQMLSMIPSYVPVT